MFIGSDSVKYKGKIPLPGMILRLANDPSINKAGGTCQAIFDAYASEEDLENKNPLAKRYLSVTLCASEEKAKQMSGRGGGLGDGLSVAYHCPDVVRCWGKKPKNGILQDSEWPDNLWAQAQLLAGMTDELAGFSIDEPTLKASIEAGVVTANARKPKVTGGTPP